MGFSNKIKDPTIAIDETTILEIKTCNIAHTIGLCIVVSCCKSHCGHPKCHIKVTDIFILSHL